MGGVNVSPSNSSVFPRASATVYAKLFCRISAFFFCVLGTNAKPWGSQGHDPNFNGLAN